MRATKLCRIEWCGAPRNSSGYCPGHARVMAGEVSLWERGSDLEKARSRARDQCRRAGVAYSPTASAPPAAAAPRAPRAPGSGPGA